MTDTRKNATVYVYYDRIGQLGQAYSNKQEEIDPKRKGWTWCWVIEDDADVCRAKNWYNNPIEAEKAARFYIDPHINPQYKYVVEVTFPPRDILEKIIEKGFMDMLTEDRVLAWLEKYATNMEGYADRESSFGKAMFHSPFSPFPPQMAMLEQQIHEKTGKRVRKAIAAIKSMRIGRNYNR